MKRKAEAIGKDESQQATNTDSSPPAKKQAREKTPPTRTEFRDGLFDARTLKTYTEIYASSKP